MVEALNLEIQRLKAELLQAHSTCVEVGRELCESDRYRHLGERLRRQARRIADKLPVKGLRQ